MNANLSNAVRMFYGKSSYEMVYMEAIANAMDAMVAEINIEISAQSKKIAERLEGPGNSIAILAKKSKGCGSMAS